MENKEKNCGGIWIQQSRGGEYLSIQIEIDGKKAKYVAFKNKYKKDNAKAPDFSVFLSVPKNASPQESSFAQESDIGF